MGTILSLERTGKSLVYKYTVRIEATDRTLTVEGFVLNNELVQEYFDTRFGTKAPKWDAVSCELMAVTAAKELAERICNSGVDCKKVDVSITGSNGAKITASWMVNHNAGR